MEHRQAKLIEIDKLFGAEYNPRKPDAKRLAIVELSLRKFGWLLPLYALPSGQLLSGHQRTKSAKTIGFKRIPVVTIDFPDKEVEKFINIVFNRATNDMRINKSSSSLADQLHALNVDDIEKMFPDVVPNSLPSYPCMRCQKMNAKELYAVQDRMPEDYMIAGANMLAKFGVSMPIVINESKQVVNGLGRLGYWAGREEDVQCVVIPDSHGDAASTLLNLLTMDFRVEESYGDELRPNALRSSDGVRDWLGKGQTFALPKNHQAKFDHKKYGHVWRDVYGLVTLDFGAGHRDEARIVRSMGVRAIAFEPYPVTSGKKDIGKDHALQIIRRFLDEVRQRTAFSSIFLSSVMQAIPFPQDRRNVLRVIHAVASSSTKFYVCSRSRNDGEYVLARNGGVSRSSMAFELDEEEGSILVLSWSDCKPAIQHFYSVEEFHHYLDPLWHSVVVKVEGAHITAICSKPKTVDVDLLREAIEFEFNLPYPDGSRMGLVDEAKAAFNQGLGINL